MKKEQKAIVLNAIDSIKNENHRKALSLRYFESMEYKEIADAMGVSIHSVKVWLNRAKAELFDVLNKHSALEN